MRTHKIKISILTLCTALSVLEASSLDENIVEKVARSKTTGALHKEKTLTLQQYAQGRTELVLALNSAIGPDFEVALKEILGSNVPTDGLTQKQITEILQKVATNKKTNALVAANAERTSLLVRASLAPVFGSLTINNNYLIQNFTMQSNTQGSIGSRLLQSQEKRVYPGGIPNPPLSKTLSAQNNDDKENAGDSNHVKRSMMPKGNKRFSFGEIFPLPEED